MPRQFDDVNEDFTVEASQDGRQDARAGLPPDPNRRCLSGSEREYFRSYYDEIKRRKVEVDETE